MPIVGSLNSEREVAGAFGESDVGEVAPAGAPLASIDKIQQLRAEPKRRRRMNKLGSVYAHRRRNRRLILQQMEDILPKRFYKTPSEHEVRAGGPNARS